MNGISTYSYLGLPTEVTVTVLTITLIAALVPYASGADLGIFKIPRLLGTPRKRFRITGPIALVFSILFFLPVWPKTHVAEAQLTRWNPVDQMEPGIKLIGSETTTTIPWTSVGNEIEKRLLPQINQVPRGSHVELRDFRGKANWIIAVVSPAKETVANVWFGPDPLNGWRWDGLVRVGYPPPKVRVGHPPPKDSKEKAAVVWQTFQRYSDGSYRRK